MHGLTTGIKTQERKTRTLSSWERHWTSSLLSSIECSLHLPVVAATNFNVSYTSGTSSECSSDLQKMKSKRHLVWLFWFRGEFRGRWGEAGSLATVAAVSMCRGTTEILRNPPNKNTGTSGVLGAVGIDWSLVGTFSFNCIHLNSSPCGVAFGK